MEIMKDNFMGFINNTSYKVWQGELATYIILEEQPEYNISQANTTFTLRGLCIISTQSNDYLLLGTEYGGRVRMDCMKIVGMQLAPISDEAEYVQCNTYVQEIISYMRGTH